MEEDPMFGHSPVTPTLETNRQTTFRRVKKIVEWNIPYQVHIQLNVKPLLNTCKLVNPVSYWNPVIFICDEQYWKYVIKLNKGINRRFSCRFRLVYA